MPKKKYDVEQVLEDRKAHIARLRKADVAAAKKKESSWVSRLKRNIQLLTKGPKHSKAGKKYLASKKGY